MPRHPGGHVLRRPDPPRRMLLHMALPSDIARLRHRPELRGGRGNDAKDDLHGVNESKIGGKLIHENRTPGGRESQGI